MRNAAGAASWRVAIAFLAAMLAVATGRVGAAPLKYTLHLEAPMRTDAGAQLEAGTYDVVFEPAPGGGSSFTASYFLKGRLVAKGRAELRGAPPGTKLADIAVPQSARLVVSQGHARQDGAVHACDYDANVKGTMAFFHALLTEIGMPELDAASKAPAVLTVKTPRGIPPIALPTPTPTPTPTKK